MKECHSWELCRELRLATEDKLGLAPWAELSPGAALHAGEAGQVEGGCALVGDGKTVWQSACCCVKGAGVCFCETEDGCGHWAGCVFAEQWEFE